jgi:hypothetical protein
MGFNSTVMMRLSRDIYRMDVNIRTSTDTARVMQWQKLRVLAPDYLMIGGLTLAFIHSMIEAGESVLEVRHNMHIVSRNSVELGA